ncbi:H(+)/Cl(-) exchange transporter ClcA [mine drainage metagenome]|uniref:H(+)/Cl(-) exchange transporter ClcA n=1 Tax=mine drainage metagenome TaxID=410659 RepID=A0A1J5PXX1_9ZZZZ
MATPTQSVSASWLLRLTFVTALVGVAGGLSGLVITLLLHAVQHFAYGYSEGTFLEGLLGVSSWRRVVALTFAGSVGAVGWWALRKWGKPVVSITKSVAGARMPTLATLVNAGLQIVVVGLGASIGREVAPRELGSLSADWLSHKFGVSARERRILVACGAGAGLAAVYNVPLGGALFAIEILLAEVSFATALPALATSAIATLIAHLVVPVTPLYRVAQSAPFTSFSLLTWSVLVGPVIGFGSVGFVRLVRVAGLRRPTGWRIVAVMPVVCLAIGLLSIPYPAILGNGRSLGQIAFDATTPLAMIALLMLLKVVATVGTVGSGAAGGMLTPSLAIGAAFGAVTGGLWTMLWPGPATTAFAFIGAAAFLASSMRAPMTALILVIEFTNQGPALLVPSMLAIAGSVLIGYLIGRRRLIGFA